MKTKCFLILLFLCTTIQAQKIKILEGKIKNLKGIAEYNLVFDYSDVEIPKYDSEADFLKDKIQKREQNEVGSGEKFKKSWFSDRQEFYEPKFIESFDKRFDDGEIKVLQNDENAKYTMQIHTTLMYPGYNVGVWKENAKIDAVVTVYETSAPSNVLVSTKYINVPGSGAFGFDYNSGYRISEAYAKLAKSLASQLHKAYK